MAPAAKKQASFNFKTATAEVEQKGEGILFYILPPLVVAAVFVYCHLNSPDPAPIKPTAVKHIKSNPTYSTTAQYIEDDEDDENDGNENNDDK